ncbi:MAG: hypothetical protein AMJ60_01620 [Desulfobacterales bacterium SG8_35]|nr:MAG: hypothetical protein AMJ60_01620 [Desulfobacterales bacterium SG8_35]
MGAGKQEDTELDEQAGGSRYLSCQVCGRRVKADDCSWQEDEDGICCPLIAGRKGRVVAAAINLLF